VLESCEGEGRAFTKIEYLKAIKFKTKTLTLNYEDDDGEGGTLSVTAGRARGNIRCLNESDGVEVERPEAVVKIEAIVPAKLVAFATGAIAFKPLMDASNPSAIIVVENKVFSISAYDTYIGTHYETMNENIHTRKSFHLTVGMDYWRTVTIKMGTDGVIKMGADDKNFRVKTNTFDLYHAVMQEDPQNVKEVINTFRSGEEHLAVVEFDGKAATEAIETTKGTIKAADKDGARFSITIKENVITLSAESTGGKMTAEFDANAKLSGDEDVNFQVSSKTWTDLLKLTRDEALKYVPVRLYLGEKCFVLESLKVPASSISPVLQD
jgi:hypothetical protein